MHTTKYCYDTQTQQLKENATLSLIYNEEEHSPRVGRATAAPASGIGGSKEPPPSDLHAKQIDAEVSLLTADLCQTEQHNIMQWDDCVRAWCPVRRRVGTSVKVPVNVCSKNA